MAIANHSNILETKRDFPAHRPNDALSSNKKFDPIPKINLRIFSILHIAKKYQHNSKYL